ncbi:MAG: SET domain-containing protein [Gammaproteobacteria bacterium]|nr:SET domain-containing protein [Gammaproteobacteria bacterium]
MIHPNTELKFVNNEIGNGVFATEFIPKGTILYVKDEFEIEVSKSRFNKMGKLHRDIIEKYSYMDERGVRVLSWDNAKYINHRCDCNSMSTAYGFEIAIRDISADEEITDEYGMFNIPESVKISCGCSNCRQMLLPTDIDNNYKAWDVLVKDAIEHINHVDQPLWDILDDVTKNDLMGFLLSQDEYRSVINLKHNNLTKKSPDKISGNQNNTHAA